MNVVECVDTRVRMTITFRFHANSKALVESRLNNGRKYDEEHVQTNIRCLAW